jgi:hypothetical protein
MSVVKIAMGVFLGVVLAYFTVDVLRTRASNTERLRAETNVWTVTPGSLVAHCGKPLDDDTPPSGMMRALIYPQLAVIFSRSGSEWKELMIQRTGIQAEQTEITPADAARIMPCLAN